VPSAARRALLAAPVPKPARPKLPLVGIASVPPDVVPVTNRETPAVEVTIGKPCCACRAMTSARRPPHPVRDTPEAMALCHCACWSECENRLSGRLPAA